MTGKVPIGVLEEGWGLLTPGHSQRCQPSLPSVNPEGPPPVQTLLPVPFCHCCLLGPLLSPGVTTGSWGHCCPRVTTVPWGHRCSPDATRPALCPHSTLSAPSVRSHFWGTGTMRRRAWPTVRLTTTR